MKHDPKVEVLLLFLWKNLRSDQVEQFFAVR